MKVSVVTCAYNAEKTIARTIESVLNQTYQDVEHIIINDGSTDATLEIAEKYRMENPERITIKSTPNRGLAVARTEGLAMCNGDLYNPLDADDYLEPDTLERAVAVFEGDLEIDICFFGYKMFDETGKFFKFYTDIFEYPKTVLTGLEAFQLKVRNKVGIGPGNLLYKLQLIRENNIQIPANMNQGEDMYFIFRSLFAARKVGFFEGDNFCYMVRQGSMTFSGFNDSYFSVLKLLDQVEVDVRQSYSDQLCEILPAIDAERIIQSLMIIKRMVKAFPLKEFLHRARPVLEVLQTVDKKTAATYLNTKKKIEYAICKNSLPSYYYISKIYYRVV